MRVKKPAFVYFTILIIFVAVTVCVLLVHRTQNSYSLADVPSQRQLNKIDLNSATAEQLQIIPGVGPTLSQKIIDYREANGPFESVEDILEIDGIGMRLLSRFMTYATIGE